MSLRSAAAAAAFLAAACGSASAQETLKGFSQDYVACQSRAHGNTVQIGLCGQAEIVSQDARLNKAYQQVMRQLASDPAGRQALQAEERSWLKRRDYECQIDGNTINTTCLVRATAARANALEEKIRF